MEKVKPVTAEELRAWLDSRGVNGYSGSISVEDVIRHMLALQKEFSE